MCAVATVLVDWTVNDCFLCSILLILVSLFAATSVHFTRRGKRGRRRRRRGAGVLSLSELKREPVIAIAAVIAIAIVIVCSYC